MTLACLRCPATRAALLLAKLISKTDMMVMAGKGNRTMSMESTTTRYDVHMQVRIICGHEAVVGCIIEAVIPSTRYHARVLLPPPRWDVSALSHPISDVVQFEGGTKKQNGGFGLILSRCFHRRIVRHSPSSQTSLENRRWGCVVLSCRY